MEGLILKKIAYQDRHLIINLLLRSAQCLSVLCYGGQGGGKKQKVDQLQLGSLVSVNLNHRSQQSELVSGKDWKVQWVSNQIRKNHRRFFAQCFLLEVAKVFAPTVTFADIEQQDSTEFSLLSNALYYLDQECERKIILMYLTKMMFVQGIFPRQGLEKELLQLIQQVKSLKFSELAQVSSEHLHSDIKELLLYMGEQFNLSFVNLNSYQFLS